MIDKKDIRVLRYFYFIIGTLHLVLGYILAIMLLFNLHNIPVWKAITAMMYSCLIVILTVNGSATIIRGTNEN